MGLAVLLLFVYCKYWRPKSRMYISHEHDIDVFVKDNDEPLDLKSVFTVALSGKIKGSVKYTGEVRELISGKPQDAAYGFIHYMKVAPDRVYAGLSKGTAAIRAEFECYRGEEADVYLECLNYVMYEAAGSSPKLFANSPHARDCDENGVRPDRLTPCGEGMRLADFLTHQSSVTAHLKEEHVIALRVYTTWAFRGLNNPLRDTNRGRPHPFPVTIAFLRDAISKLRAVGAEEDAARPTGEEGKSETRLDLWRGMRGLKETKDFMLQGGTELAPMSTTTKLEVAIAYSDASTSLIFKIRTDTFMQRGASIQFLSAFPDEEEVLYPPLTFVKPTGRSMSKNFKGRNFKVIEVSPQFGG